MTGESEIKKRSFLVTTEKGLFFVNTQECTRKTSRISMGFIRGMFKELFSIEPHERLKVLFLSMIFFLIVGAYTITRDLKSAIFMSVVGREYIPWAKMASMFLLVPLILFYSTLVDQMRRYQLLATYSFIFGLLGLVFTFCMGNPQIGLPNTTTSPYRIFGWLFYFFVEAYSPFVVSVFWAFANSISSPEGARKSYGFIVSGSKMGGMITAGLAWYLFSISAKGQHEIFSDVVTHQIILAVSSVMLLLVPLVIFFLVKMVSSEYLHGYEAAYRLEHQKAPDKKVKTSMFAGISMFAKYPYVFGIFGLVFFYEVINVVLGYLRLGVAEEGSANVSAISALLFEMMFKTHAIGMVISLFGTRMLLQKLGTTLCLLLVPLTTGIFLLYLMWETTPSVLVNAFVLFKAIHYAISWPVRETLYIPTVKEIKFKSRSWIDAFGSKIARTGGSIFNVVAARLGTDLLVPAHSFFFAGIIGVWFVVALLLGRRFEKAINANEVIGAETVE
jgi:ATP:ADP antiporter, AAA family